MFDLNDLYYFVQSVDHGGFAPAGRALNMPKSKLSRRIAMLEERLGVRLIQRSTRHFSVTDVGQTYYEHCKAMLVEAEAAQESVDAHWAEPRGTLRISCPVALLHLHVGKMVTAFMLRYPHIDLHLEATNRRIDVLGEGFDVAIRVRPLPLEDSNLVMRVLSDRGQCLVASPDLIKRYGFPVLPADLQTWPSLGLGQPQNSFYWDLHGPDGAHARVPHSPRFITTDMVTLLEAALAGIGVLQLPSIMVAEQLEKGDLVRIVPDWAPRREVIHAVFPSRRGLLPGVRLLIDHLADSYAKMIEN
ncbi:LysR family transcriptional regulator [[Pantoea] beijingensis]|uniref:LysR family transcriptional regulator n=1 Tax=[Pantoea] beijingensis TaxID=1324864 RepID=A0A443IGG8_9GAMM|nr:LysR family transcriptional regulator [[Pantoea] beijingensis]RWR03158.1 LysR family transcriptional regulator [[Pantoea] beijingensis]